MATVTDYQVVFVNENGAPKALNEGAVLNFSPSLPSNFVEGTNLARPVVMFLVGGEPGSVLEVVAKEPGTKFPVDDSRFQTLHAFLDGPALKAAGFKFRCTKGTVSIAHVVLMYQVEIGG